ncbi:sigma-70 family RNA polymerase sigma factor [Streptomyces ficellus]|uniref:sigma-70 family RNA polymerase sigma factor n=1 Tax=Streptomyces ficellus TaxID=1977088 RepID=UPI003EBE8BF1
MDIEREAAVVRAAQSGEQWAQDRLVAAYLPLVHNIVGRALNGHADVDDVVQESMIRALDRLGSLRDPERFRAWLVAITMNRIRGHRQAARREAPVGGEPRDADDVADPGADFVDLTIVRLGLSGQRKEVAEATRWLDEDDRTLLSLWWLEAAGELTRAEVAAAMELSRQHTAVRVQRMKAQLETARLVVRALSAVPRCVLLDDVLGPWDGVPSALWRKRLARHARGCTVCSACEAGLVPAEGLLVGLGLVPVAAARWKGAAATGGGGGGADPAGHHDVVGGPVTPADALVAPVARGRRAKRRGGRPARRRTVVVGAVALLVGGGGVFGVTLLFPDQDAGAVLSRPAAESAPAPAPTGRNTATAPATSPSPPPSGSPSPSATPRVTASPSDATVSATPRRTPVPAARREVSPSPDPGSRPPAAPASLGGQVTELVNAERRKNGCGPVRQNSRLDTAAQRHSGDMDARDFFDHTAPDGTGPGERITAAGYEWSTYGENIARGQQTPSQVMRSWMDSPGHRANIVNCSFDEIGVGVHQGPGGPWWTQVFGASH